MTAETAKPDARRTSDATLSQLRAWHESRFGRLAVDVDRAANLPSPIVATGPTGRTILLDPDTGEVIE